jgi:YcaO-like protein with predicted kinase domain
MTRGGPPSLEGPIAKGYHGGTYRIVAPEETIERVRRYLPIMGITRVANVTGLDCVGIPVALATRPNSRSLAVSQGKGLTLAAAKASAVMESIEAYHAERTDLPLMLGSYEDLRYRHRLADVRALPRVAHSRFHPALPLLWIEGFDLLQQEPAWVPYEMVSVNYTLPRPTGFGCFSATSNGLASGNHLGEAISHGICELIERDATTMWSLLDEDARSATRIDLDTVDDPDCRELLDRYRRAGVDVAVWETTSDLGVPSFVCLIVERDDAPGRSLHDAFGYGCHPARRVALLRALTEAAQVRLTAVAGSRDDLTRIDYDEQEQPGTRRRTRSLIETGPRRRNYRGRPDWDAERLDEDLARELGQLRAAGIRRVVAVDLTRPEFGLPVVRMVIPGLEALGLLPDYSPGRRARARLMAAG